MKPLREALPAMRRGASPSEPSRSLSPTPPHGSGQAVGPTNSSLADLAGKSVVELDRLVTTSLPPSLKWEARYSADHEILAWTASGTLADLQTAERLLTAMMRPLGPDRTAREMAEMIVLTARPKDGPDPKMMAAAYQKRLAQYPADAVIWALREWPNRSKWFPTWAELSDLLSIRTGSRRHRLNAIRAAMRLPKSPAGSKDTDGTGLAPGKRTMTPDQKMTEGMSEDEGRRYWLARLRGEEPEQAREAV